MGAGFPSEDAEMQGSAKILAFDEHELDFGRNELRRGEKPVDIQPTPLRLLLYLAEHRDRTVPRRELLDAIWPGVAVGDEALTTALAEARHAVGDDGSAQRVIRTRKGAGYRFVAPVRVEAGQRGSSAAGIDERADSTAESANGASGPPSRSRRHAAMLAGAVALGALAIAGWRVGAGRGFVTQPSAAKLAVLPFDPLGAGDDLRSFAAGLTDEVLTTLSDRGIPVVSRDDAGTLTGRERGRRIGDVGVAQLLSGTVQREGGTLIVRVHLDDPVRHAVLWSKKIEGAADEPAVFQARVATAIVNVLWNADAALRPADGLSDPALLARYLRGVDLMENRSGWDLSGSEAFEVLTGLREVTRRAPSFAPAHAGLAWLAAWRTFVVPQDQAPALRAEAAEQARQALAIDPRSTGAHLARSLLLPQSQWAERERLLRQVHAVAPARADTNLELAGFLVAVGRVREAVVFGQAAAASSGFPFDAWVGFAAGESQPCIDALSKQLRLEPQSAAVWYPLLTCQTGHWDAALAMLEDPTAPTHGTPLGSALIAANVAGKTQAPGDIATARKLLLAAAAGSSFDMRAAFYSLAVLGQVDDAFRAAEHYAPDAHGADWMLFLPGTESMRRDPRFMKVAKRIGLVDYWQQSVHWPDFCAEPDLPYDCRSEAAKN